jgi:hypothetical protein
MFHIPSYFQIVFNHSKWSGWSTPKAVSEGLSLILFPEVKSQMGDTFFNKFYNGANKGRTLYVEIQERLADEQLADYIYQMERSFSSVNYRGNKFDCEAVIAELLENIKNATNLTGSIRDGLIRSYQLHLQTRPYLFLSEALYYALELQNNKNAEYREFDPNVQPPSLAEELTVLGKYIDEETLNNTNCSPRLRETLRLMSGAEMDTFVKLAKLALIDEDEKPYLYAPVTDDEIDLYKKYGIGNQEFLMMEECDLINMGARINNFMEVTDDAYYGFQNDNLVLAMTAEPGKSCRVEYKSYVFTSVGVQLLELLQVDTDDYFFTELVEIFKQRLNGLPIKILLLAVEETEELEAAQDLALIF